MNAVYAIVYIEAWKIQNFNEVISNQLSYEATDVGSWSFVGSNEPVRDECEFIYEIFNTWIHIRSHTPTLKTKRNFSLRSQNSEYPRIFQVMGANQKARKLLPLIW